MCFFKRTCESRPSRWSNNSSSKTTHSSWQSDTNNGLQPRNLCKNDLVDFVWNKMAFSRFFFSKCGPAETVYFQNLEISRELFYQRFNFQRLDIPSLDIQRFRRKICIYQQFGIVVCTKTLHRKKLLTKFTLHCFSKSFPISWKNKV